ncbi:RNA-guided endonuclease InsQ/TnpB family protein [Streptomyces flaveus]|uniref:Transposase n=1 Tax=Streptomyces flaveus TaxID=66370 RepID=A0A917QIA6_9ACTN|nr:RNA-guided endonuclease TnpB family protein [Streptomyces flaveus]GGK52101.1 transposase [Streptomyces flaveus]
MKRQRGHKARLHLTPDQLAQVDGQGHGARAMWNLLHELWQMTPKCQRSLARMDQAIRQARKDIPWLGAVPAQAAQQVLKTYHRAWVNCWEGRAEAPAFKKRAARRAVDIPQGRDLRITRLSRRWGQCWVPMVGLVKFRWTKALPYGKRADKHNKVTGARLVKEANGWHIVFRVQTEVDEPKPHEGPITGIDRGIAKPLALSDGTFREHEPWLTPGEAMRLKRLEQQRERRRAHRKPGERTSSRLKRTYDQIKQLRARATRRALDWQHKATTELAGTFGVIGVEDLAITNMVKSAKGTVEAPGTNVRQKAGLNRSISGEAWGRTVTFLEYKLADRGGVLVKVPAPNTSRRCSACGFITPGSRESQSRFVCKADGCGFVENADTNAARNIEHAAGHAVSGRGDLGVTRS